MAEANKSVRISARWEEEIVHVRALIEHPMETGYRRDPLTGGYWPENFITEANAWINGELALEMQWSIAISRNPYFEFKYLGQTGDRIDLRLIDNRNKVYEGSEIVS